MRILANMDAETPFDLVGDVRAAHSLETAIVNLRKPAPYEIDSLGHVNNVVYLAWAQEMGLAHWRQVASTEQLDAYIWVGLHHDISYQREIRQDDSIELRTWLTPPKGPRLERHVDVRRAGEQAFAAYIRSTWCLIDAASRKPKRISVSVGGRFGFGDHPNGMEPQSPQNQQ